MPIVSSDAALFKPQWRARALTHEPQLNPNSDASRASAGNAIAGLVITSKSSLALFAITRQCDDIDNYRKLARAIQSRPWSKPFNNTHELGDIISAEEMLADPEMKAFANEEIPRQRASGAIASAIAHHADPQRRKRHAQRHARNSRRNGRRRIRTVRKRPAAHVQPLRRATWLARRTDERITVRVGAATAKSSSSCPAPTYTPP